MQTSLRRTLPFFLILIIASLVLRLCYLRTSEIIVDEFQHLHSAYLTYHGAIPYLDFFEHHTPLFYFLAAAVLPLDNADFSGLIHARYLAVLFSMGTILVSVLIARRTLGLAESLVALALLLSNFFLFSYGSRSYLDTYAGFLVALSALLLIRAEGSTWKLALTGMCLCLAVLFTQKTLVVGLVPLLWFLSRIRSKFHNSTSIKPILNDLGAMTIGFLLGLALLPLLLGLSGIEPFYQQNFALNARWKARHFPSDEFVLLAKSDGFIFAIATLGALIKVYEMYRRGFTWRDKDLPLLFLISCLAGIFVLPVVWEEYFIVYIPFLLIVGAETIVRFVRQYLVVDNKPMNLRGASLRIRLLVLFALSVLPISLFLRVFVLGHPISFWSGLFLAMLWAILALVLGTQATATILENKPWAKATLWMLVITGLGWTQQFDSLIQSDNSYQRDRVDYIVRNSKPTDLVLDGYTGFGVFRPHAYKYWFIHEEVLLMLPELEPPGSLLQALETKRPLFVIFDFYIAAHPEAKSIKEYLEKNYTATPFKEIWKRRDHTDTVYIPLADAADQKV